MFNLRGFNASNSLFVDGVRDDGLISRDVFNLEQVEVFMGPTGSDVGRGTAAGYVNMQTKAPHLGSSTATAYSLGHGRPAAAERRLQLGRCRENQDSSWLGKSAFRLNALWQDGGVPGRDVVERESMAVAPSLALGLGTPTRVTSSAQFTAAGQPARLRHPGRGLAGCRRWRRRPFMAAAPVDQSNFYGSVGYDYDKADQNRCWRGSSTTSRAA